MGYYENEGCHQFGSKAQANLNTVLGIAGTVGLLNGNDGGLPILGGGNKTNELRAENAKLQSELLSRSIAQDLYNKMAADNKELSGYLCAERNRTTALEGQIATNKAEAEAASLRLQLELKDRDFAYRMDTEKRLGALEASVPLVQERCMGAICAEREKRECADNAIVNYVNATFYPKLVADVTAGTTTTAQVTYNPLPCQCK